jgi:hypothetical protein
MAASAVAVPPWQPTGPFNGYAMITKVRCTYTIRILRQDKSLRDHGEALDGPM